MIGVDAELLPRARNSLRSDEHHDFAVYRSAPAPRRRVGRSRRSRARDPRWFDTSELAPESPPVPPPIDLGAPTPGVRRCAGVRVSSRSATSSTQLRVDRTVIDDPLTSAPRSPSYGSRERPHYRAEDPESPAAPAFDFGARADQRAPRRPGNAEAATVVPRRARPAAVGP